MKNWLNPRWSLFVLGLHVLAGPLPAPAESTAANPLTYAAWKNGLPTRPDYFPIGVWVQNPRNAARFKAAGINLYVGLWRGPTGEQLEMLREASMPVICSQNQFARQHLDEPLIVGWMHGDEPDNAQSLGTGKGYGPPILPEKIIGDYQKLRAADPSRPVLLNLGQGVAYDNYIGRGVRRNHPEDYAEYVKGADIVSFDIYPAVHDSPEVAGKLEFVANGVERLGRWTAGAKPVWNCLECTRISNVKTKPTPAQVRTEAWMALVHGSRGFIYFVHQFKPEFREAALLDDPEMLSAVTALNRQITELAPVLNSPTIDDAVRVNSENTAVPIRLLGKRHEGWLYVFAVAMRNEPTKATFKVANSKDGNVEVIGENRSVPVAESAFADEFNGYGVHLYRLRLN